MRRLAEAARAGARVVGTASVAALLVIVVPTTLGDPTPPSLASPVTDVGPVPAVAPEPAPAAATLPRPHPGRCDAPVADGRDDPVVRSTPWRLARLACDPLASPWSIPATDLEQEEPERLYALVTRERPLEPLRYAPEDLVDVDGGPYRARAEVAAHVEALMAAGAAAGHEHLHLVSGYRDYDTQVGTHLDWLNRVGAERADQISARAGYSEHQLGLAVDLSGVCGGFACFGQSEDGRWVAANAHRYGFIVRYPEGGQAVTGYTYEPWHLRYVGPRAAWAMHLAGEVYWDDFHEVALDAADAHP